MDKGVIAKQIQYFKPGIAGQSTFSTSKRCLQKKYSLLCMDSDGGWITRLDNNALEIQGYVG